ncbi:3'-5' exonuclease [Aureibaculum sp. 2210JD6-5]|uniref:3'-5' exonuclease n=1 Tax=Aureibaculum sp. 2210JD6-5 TaxID=3103957 RepID=UPI002AAE5257|nr:3'-5' exonuclease [Aureibaculum sp. 2210JD6-5]MDY7396179.1 3'-5' exonuclease [Aureibaculum sp. 2210JD6-5]
MLNKIKLENILFLDIETVPEVATFDELSELKKELFSKKTEYHRKDEVSAEDFYERAGIWAEFGKVICISVGYFVNLEGNRNFRITSFSGDEKQILIDFKDLLDNHFNKNVHLLCAHNGKEFDFPYIARRMIINSITLPEKLNLFGKKPWEVAHLDTLELWKFGDYKHYTSLNLLTNILGIPSPKQDIDGSQVAKVFYEENDIERIIKYCERDTLAVAQLLLRFNNLDLLNDDEIVVV